MASISIIVPVYKVKCHLSRCIESILAQSYSDYDFILVDDGSPDQCGKICDDKRFIKSSTQVVKKESFTLLG